MPGKLTFGYLYDFRNPPQWHRPWADLYAETLDLIAWTESIGFEGAWVPEHHLADDGYMPSPLVTLVAIAARTSRMRIGSGVALAPLYNPVRFAEDCAVLDILSNGRLDICLGIGYRKRETAALGVDFTRRGARFDEFLQIVTRLWQGETVDFAGKHFEISGASVMPPAPSGGIPSTSVASPKRRSSASRVTAVAISVLPRSAHSMPGSCASWGRIQRPRRCGSPG